MLARVKQGPSLPHNNVSRLDILICADLVITRFCYKANNYLKTFSDPDASLVNLHGYGQCRRHVLSLFGWLLLFT